MADLLDRLYLILTHPITRLVAVGLGLYYGWQLVVFGRGIGWIPGLDEDAHEPPMGKRRLATGVGAVLIAVSLAMLLTLIL